MPDQIDNNFMALFLVDIELLDSFRQSDLFVDVNNGGLEIPGVVSVGYPIFQG